jgi:alkaline phosphatase D
MERLRRHLLTAGAGLSTLALLPLRALQAQSGGFANDPFTLGVASGYPEPTAVVLWTRLAPEPLAPGGGMAPEIVSVDWEIANDERFRRIVVSGQHYATPDWAHSVHVEVTGLSQAGTIGTAFVPAASRAPSAGREPRPPSTRICRACGSVSPIASTTSPDTMPPTAQWSPTTSI